MLFSVNVLYVSIAEKTGCFGGGSKKKSQKGKDGQPSEPAYM